MGQTILVADVAQEKTQALVVTKFFLHLVLLELVARKYDELFGTDFAQHKLREAIAKRTRAASEKDSFVFEIHDTSC